MAETFLYVSMSLDGYSAGPAGDLTLLHGWAFGDSSMEMDPQVTTEFFSSGAVVLGANTLRAGDEAWGDEEIFPMPVFVPTHEKREPVVRNGSLFTFVPSVEDALKQARAVAGERHVTIMGSANVAQQLLSLGLIDVLDIHLGSMLLGGGVRLFDHLVGTPIRLERTRVLASKGITHLRFRVIS